MSKNLDEIVGRASAVMAEQIDRRRFLRTASKGIFVGVTAITTGSLWDWKYARRAYATNFQCAGAIHGVGPGCPGSAYGSPCGPDPCCNATSCDCGSNGNCATGGLSCHGFDGDWGGTSCWTCVTGFVCCQDDGCACSCQYTTTCCDCRGTNCGGDSICISVNGPTETARQC